MNSMKYLVLCLFLAACGGGGDSPPVAPVVPLAQVQTDFPTKSAAGSLRWEADGTTYSVIVAKNNWAAWVSVLSAPSVTQDGVLDMTNAETLLDDSLDQHTPANNDAAVRAYLARYVVPKLDAWIKANPTKIGPTRPVGSDPPSR